MSRRGFEYWESWLHSLKVGQLPVFPFLRVVFLVVFLSSFIFGLRTFHVKKGHIHPLLWKRWSEQFLFLFLNMTEDEISWTLDSLITGKNLQLFYHLGSKFWIAFELHLKLSFSNFCFCHLVKHAFAKVEKHIIIFLRLCRKKISTDKIRIAFSIN